MKLADVERSVYSQNGEDGIIAYLADRLRNPTRTFVEIGCGSGKENNTRALIEVGWTGVLFDSKAARIEQLRARGWPVTAHAMHVTAKRAHRVMRLIPREPDVFSLDIDSTDYHVARSLLEIGFRPAIAVLEYNAAFMRRAITVPAVLPKRFRAKDIYFGAGVEAWRCLMPRYGYKFVTVERAGANAFFVVPERFSGPIELESLEWADNAHLRETLGHAKRRWARVANHPYAAAC